MDNKEISYGLGVMVGNSLVGQVNTTDVDFEELAKGLKDLLTDSLADNAQQILQNTQQYLQEQQAKAALEAVEREANFLAENGERDEVVVRDSGLQYEVLVEGSGRTPRKSDKVTVHYEGRLLSGKVFDSSIRRGQPANFPVGRLIQGWQEALQIMPVGSKWRLFIPSNLGYGKRGAGQDIPPNATLIFDMELISIG